MKKTILLTNDDGVFSKGLQLVYNSLCSEYDVTIVAPHKEQSGVGHSFTYNNPLFFNKIENGFSDKMFSVTGSPADCVKFAISQIMPFFPDFIVSGMNIGENSGVSSYYSGTVAGAREGAFWRIRSFAFSLCSEAEKYAEKYAQFIPQIIDLINNADFIKDLKIFYNINFPPYKPTEISGIKFTRQSMAFFQDKYKPVLTELDCQVVNAFEIYGEKEDVEESDEFDSRALINKWITITPHTFDSTSYNYYSSYKSIENKFVLKGD